MKDPKTTAGYQKPHTPCCKGTIVSSYNPSMTKLHAVAQPQNVKHALVNNHNPSHIKCSPIYTFLQHLQSMERVCLV